MSRTLLIWLPAPGDDADAPAAWLRVDDGIIVDSGQDDGWVDAWEKPRADDADGERLIALAPAATAPVQWRHYPDAAPAQAAAAARIDALRDSLGAPETLHIVAGTPAEAGQAVPVVVTTHGVMAGWADWLRARGLDAAAIIPAAATVPPPEPGQPWLAELGGEAIVRTADRAYRSDPHIDALIAADHAISPIDGDAMRAALLLSLAAPPIDLLSGGWKPRRSWGVDPVLVRLGKRMLAALIVISIAIPVVHAVRLAADTRRADAAAVETARKAGVNAPDAAAAEAELDRRLASAGGGPLAYSVPAAALFDALRDAPGVTLKTLSHRTDGTLTTMLAGARVDDLNKVLLALQARGYRVTAQPMAGTDGQQMANITVRAVP